MKRVVIFEFQDVRFASRALKEAFSLLNNNYDVTLIGYSLNSFRVRKSIVNGLKILECPVYLNPKKSSINKLISLILFNLLLLPHFICRKYDIYHAHDLKIMWLVKVAYYIYRNPIVYDAHELHLEKRNLKNKKDAILRNRDFKKELFFIKKSSLIIQANIKRAEFFKERYKTNLPLIIQNHDTYRSKESFKEGIDLKKKIGLSKYDWLLIFTGFVSVGGNQRIETVIQGLSYLPANVHFCVIGSLVANAEKKIDTLAKDYKVSERVHLMQPVKSEQVVRTISTADLAIIPIYADCLNSEYSALNKVSQSLMAGLPIICSGYDNLKEIVYNNNSGIVGNTFDIMNPIDFANAVKGVIDNPVEYQKMKRRCFILAKNSFNWEKEEKKLIHAYNLL